MTARILVIDLETQRSIVETFSLFRPFIHIDRVIRDSRILCFAARWRGEEKMIFKSCWQDDDEDAYKAMLQSAWDLLDEADFVVTFNGDRFDIQWLQEEFGCFGLGRPTPCKSLDLFKTQKKHFRAGLLSGKLDWSSRKWLKDRKIPHGGTDLWHDIRYGNRAERREAQRTMRTYCEHDTRLTGKLFEAYLPWINVNFALYEDNDDELLHCTKCNSTNMKRDGKKKYGTSAYLYQMHRCKDCDGTSRGKRFQSTTELRPV